MAAQEDHLRRVAYLELRTAAVLLRLLLSRVTTQMTTAAPRLGVVQLHARATGAVHRGRLEPPVHGTTVSMLSRNGRTSTDQSPERRHLEERQDDGINYCDDNSNNGFTPIGAGGPLASQRKMLIAHGVLACLAFVIFFPMGAIAIRLASFPGVVWLHAAFQIFAYLVYIAAFGLGVYIASGMDLVSLDLSDISGYELGLKLTECFSSTSTILSLE